MHYTQLITAFAMAWGASTAAASAVSHGEVGVIDGVEYRYHQLARDIFTGVPVERWDDSIHTRSDEVWDLDALAARQMEGMSDKELVARNLPNEARNLADVCQAVTDCFIVAGDWTLNAVFNNWLAAALAATKDTPLMQFLNQPFIANSVGITAFGKTGGSGGASCSTSNSDADAIGAAVSAALAAKPDATEVSVTVTGGASAWTITIATAPGDVTPALNCSS